MKKYKYLFKNIGLLTLSNFATKLLSFFLVPLYTSILSTGQYGTYDLFNTTVSVLIPIFTLNILDAVLRFGMDKEYDKNAIITLSTKWLIISCFFIALMIVINHFITIVPILEKYKLYFFLMFFTQAFSGIITSYARGTDHVASLSVSSVIASVVTILANIIFLIPLRLGLPGYFLANVIGPFVQCLYLCICLQVWRNLKWSKDYSNNEREMFKYSTPLIANSISWWINNVSDRYIVTWFCGIAANGVYSVSTKIPSILNIFQTIFSQAWTLSVVKDFDSKDKDGFFSKTYNTYNCVMVIVCSVIIATDKLMAKFLYANEFYIAWRYVPFLTIAIVFGALSGYLGGFFTAVKDSKKFATSTIVGAILNVLLNLISVPLIGTLGAAISTAVSYVIVWALRVIQSKEYIRIKISWKRDITSYLLLLIQTVLLLFLNDSKLMYSVQFILIAGVVCLYRREIELFVSKLRRE